MSTTTNGLNSVEDADMADCDGETVVTMVDVLKEQEDFEEDANAVLGASDDKNCTYSKGYVKRQAIFACVTCCTEAKDDPVQRAGVCLACSLNCHENHELIELYTKRNFRCDCGNSKFNSHPCQFTPSKTDLNDNNSYNQNFGGIYCICQRPYPDPESNVEEEMIQCIICEDWLHATHLEATIPGNDQYSEMICKGCMENNPFLHDYSDLAVLVENADVDITNLSSSTENPVANGDTKDNEKDGKVNDNPSSSMKQTKIADNDIEMALSSCASNDNNENTDKFEKQSSTVTNPEAKSEIQDNIDNEEKNNEEEDKQTTEITETNKDDTSEETRELCGNVTDTVSSNTINETSIDTSEITNTSTDERKDSDKPLINQDTKNTTEEHRSLAKLTLEDNIQDLQDLINDNSESNSRSKSTEAIDSTETSSEISNQENNVGVIDKAKEELAPNKDNIQSNEELPNSTGNDLEINSDESTNAHSENEDVKAGSEKSAELDAQTIEGLVPEDLKPEVSDEKEMSVANDGDKNESTKDNLSSEDMTGSIENTTDSNNTEVNSIKIATEENFNHTVSKDTENHKVSEMDTAISNPSEIEELSNERNEKVSENKRKLSTENVAEEKDAVKRPKPNEIKKCSRPKEVKRIHKGATFWPSHFRQKLCTCNECLSMYKDLSVLFLIDLEDTVSFYENLGKEKVRIEGKPKSQYEKGLEALSSLDRVHQINALTEYNRMRDKLLDFLKSFKDKKEIVKEEDIKAFFANMKPKREPDGVYFCR